MWFSTCSTLSQKLVSCKAVPLLRSRSNFFISRIHLLTPACSTFRKFVSFTSALKSSTPPRHLPIICSTTGLMAITITGISLQMQETNLHLELFTLADWPWLSATAPQGSTYLSRSRPPRFIYALKYFIDRDSGLLIIA